MKRWVMDYICCPECKGSLRLLESEGDETEVLKGTLTCIKCERVYSIEEGIADLLPDNQR
ncbi:MAG TPA: methytransferase partner Trm112 [Methanocorpusculum sp.]|nr:methytransferase partner Trm112 [Methanocorpusculum sp.]